MYGYNIFHENILTSLINTVHHEKNSHSYIFSGEEGLNKHEAARLFAAALTCSNKLNSPCGMCPLCIQAKAGTNPDIITVNANTFNDDDKKTLGVDAIRKLNDDAFIKPFASSHKVYIIEGDEFTPAAQNAFLKTLEEPPLYAVFIIIISDFEKLLETVISRCTLINFPRINNDKLKQYLKNTQNLDGEKLDFIVRVSDGNPKNALKILNDDGYDILRKEALFAMNNLFSTYSLSPFLLSEYMDKNKDNADEILDFWLLFCRDILMIHNGLTNNVINIDLLPQLNEFMSKADAKVIVTAIDELTLSKQMIARFISAKAVGLRLGISIQNSIIL